MDIEKLLEAVKPVDTRTRKAFTTLLVNSKGEKYSARELIKKVNTLVSEQLEDESSDLFKNYPLFLDLALTGFIYFLNRESDILEFLSNSTAHIDMTRMFLLGYSVRDALLTLDSKFITEDAGEEEQKKVAEELRLQELANKIAPIYLTTGSLTMALAQLLSQGEISKTEYEEVLESVADVENRQKVDEAVQKILKSIKKKSAASN